jgi:hypothetical protein
MNYKQLRIQATYEINDQNFSFLPSRVKGFRIMNQIPSGVWLRNNYWVQLIFPLLLYADLENRDYGRRGYAALTMRHPYIYIYISIRKSWH